MNKKDVYIYYSGATDRTGTNLKEGLGINGGKTQPKAGRKMIIGWGAKTKKDISFPKGVKVLNHPNAIRKNRNKFEAIQLMTAALNTAKKKHIPGMVTADRVKHALANDELAYPIIGRTKYHQGGKGFWECPTVAQLDAALAEGEVHHFQEMVPVKDEYRLHIFDGECIHAVKKVQRTKEDFEKAWIEDELARQKALWEKNNSGAFSEDVVREVLRRQAKDAVAGGPNQVLRSNKMGWKFKIVKKYSADMVKVAAKAVKALGLDFGAVDCCVDVNGNPWIFEVNTGPGLEGTSFDKYIEAFEKAIGGKEAKPAAKKTAAAKAAKTKPAANEADYGKKEFMKLQLSRLQEIVEDADESEIDTIQRIGSKLIFGGQE